MTTERQQQQARKKRDNGSLSLPSNQKSSQFITADISSKPYVCNQCDLSFNRAHNLKSHLATHSTARPFQVIKLKKKALFVTIETNRHKLVSYM